MTWRDSFTHEQTGLAVPDMQVVVSTSRHVSTCDELVPEDRPVCDHGLFCKKVRRHPGPHSSKPSTCNRPFGHDGDHMVLLAKDFQVMERWS